MRDIEFKALILAKLKKMEKYAEEFQVEGRSYQRAMQEGYIRAVQELKREILSINKIKE